VGDGEKLLTHLNSALKVLLGLDIFPHVPKKKVKFCWPVLCAGSPRSRCFTVWFVPHCSVVWEDRKLKRRIWWWSLMR